jgi:hypothetical protein
MERVGTGGHEGEDGMGGHRGGGGGKGHPKGCVRRELAAHQRDYCSGRNLDEPDHSVAMTSRSPTRGMYAHAHANAHVST